MRESTVGCINFGLHRSDYQSESPRRKKVTLLGVFLGVFSPSPGSKRSLAYSQRLILDSLSVLGAMHSDYAL